ncbi:MAG: hypothetical protein RMA76_44135 [Deltaproteobacteria bacterium]|jgi:hypothetical protein
MNATERSEGTTESERRLARLCEGTFMDLWSYPNVFRDDRGLGKEVCDLLVVFDHHVIIFSDKHVEYGSDPTVAWKRWYKKAIARSAAQLEGGRRWIATHPDRLFLDRACTQRFPLAIPSPDEASYHLVVVASGARASCRRHFGRGSGSLMLDYEHNPSDVLFRVGNPSRNSFVHVFDEGSLPILLGELDTVADFVEYIQTKEDLVRNGRLISAPGEEDFLAYYLASNHLSESCAFRLPMFSEESEHVVRVGAGAWERLQSLPEYSAKQRVDRSSEIWDDLIGQFTKNMLAGTSIVRNGELDLRMHERGVREMAREPRLQRRLLGQAIIDAAHHPDAATGLYRTMLGPSPAHTAYVFWQVPYEAEIYGNDGYEGYRNERLMRLLMYIMALRAKLGKGDRFVGLAMEPLLKPEPGRSEDLAFYDTSNWSNDDQRVGEEAERILATQRRGPLDLEGTWVSSFKFPGSGM